MIKKITTLPIWGWLLLLCVQLTSCDVIMEGSLEDPKVYSGGFSPTRNTSNDGFNVVIMWLIAMGSADIQSGKLGLPPGSAPLYATEDPARNPFDQPFAAPAKSKGEFKLGFTGGFVQKGFKSDNIGTRFNYLEGQANAMYYYPLAKGGTIYGGLGPYLAYGIGGKTGNGTVEESSFGGVVGYKRFDGGLNLTAGYRFDMGLQFNLGYDLGLANISPTPDFTARNRSWSIKVGYSINKIIGAFKRD